MKTLLLGIILSLAFFTLSAQDMNFDFGFLFSNELLKNGKLVEVVEKSSPKQVEVGTIKQNDLVISTPFSSLQVLENNIDIPITKTVNELSYTDKPKKLFQTLKGGIVKRVKDGKHDTLFIKFWPIESEPQAVTDDKNFINREDNDKEFAFVIDPNYWDNHKFLKIPFRAWQFSATNLPFRILTKSGDLESEFLNANITYVRTFGQTRIFQNELMAQRNRSVSLGPYFGLSAVDNSLTTKKEFGLNYGMNAVFALQSLQFTCAFGGQNGFTKNTKVLQPYFGFGIGFKLVEFFDPEIKTED